MSETYCVIPTKSHGSERRRWSGRAGFPLTIVAALAITLRGVTAGAAVTPVEARHGMVVSAHVLASEVGIAVLRDGGNAVDAAVAVGFALAVVKPEAGNIGGGGFLVLRRADGFATTIDFRETAPLAAGRDIFLNAAGDVVPDRSVLGALAVGVPGTVAGLLLAHERYGTLPRARLIAPGIRLAREGFIVSRGLARQFAEHRKSFRNFPATMRKFTDSGGIPNAGDRWRQPALARTLDRIQEDGVRGFYDGETAQLIAACMLRNGGLVTREDLVKYRAVERAPVRGQYRGVTVLSMPPPSSGGIALLQMLAMLEPVDLARAGHNSAATIHQMVEVMRRAFADRATYLGDTDFYPVPIRDLLAPSYLARRRADIRVDRATTSSMIAAGVFVPPAESAQTTHYAIVDAEGNAVAVTYTLNGTFGSHLVVDRAGFFLNNEMDDFSAKPGTPNMYGLIGGEANAVQPGKRMLSSMTPTILVRDGRPFLITGSPGGPRIITTVLQVILNVVDHGMNIQQAVNAPRIHHQWLPDILYHEPCGLAADVGMRLETMGHTIRERASMGDANSILIDPETGMRYGAPDMRTESAAAGF